MSQENEHNNIELPVELRTSSFVSHPLLAIFSATGIGLTGLFFSIILDMPILLCLLNFLALMSIVLGFQAGKATYRLTAEGIILTIQPFLRFRDRVPGFYLFSDIISFTNDKEANRSLQEVDVLKIRVKMSPYLIILTDEVNPKGYYLFRDAFLQTIKAYNSGKLETYSPDLDPDEAFDELEMIEQRPSFYQKKIAKFITLLLVLANFTFLGLYFYGFLGSYNVLNWLIFIVPGTLYLVNRVFMKQ